MSEQSKTKKGKVTSKLVITRNQENQKPKKSSQRSMEQNHSYLNTIFY